jgi:Flp pilus assembly protein TadD
LIRLRRLQEAQQVLARAKPKLEVPELNISLGKLHLANQNFAEAEKAFRRALELAPQEGAVHYLLARTLKHQGKDGEAGQEFAQAARLKDQERQRKIWRKMLMPVDPSSAIE